MTTYIQTIPEHGVSTLHVEGCRRIHHRVGRVTMESFVEPWKKVCDACITDSVLAESDAHNAREFWQASQRAEAAERRREFDELMWKESADRYEAMHQWLPLRDWLARRFEQVSVRMYRDGSTYWQYAPIFEFHTGWPVKTAGAEVRLTCDRRVDRVSNVYVASAADAARLAEVLFVMERPDMVLKGGLL